ncbi:tetratricopeptide repeat protein [Chlamydiota bacterium]
MGTNKKLLLLSTAIIIITGFLIYSNALFNDFVWDDELLITKNHYVTHFSSQFIKNIFSSHISEGGGMRSNFYRPAQLLSYILDYFLYGLNPKGFHLTNILLHIIVSVLVLILMKDIFKNIYLGLVTSLMFLVHPIHTEAITYISGRAEPLVALFSLLCLIFFIKYFLNFRIYFIFLSSLFFMCALLSKESAIILPLLLLVTFIFKNSSKKTKFVELYILLPYILIISVYILLRLTILKFIIEDLVTPLNASPLHFFKCLSLACEILIFPHALHMEYGAFTPHLFEPRVLLGGAIILASAGSFLIKKPVFKPLQFGIIWFFISYIPYSNIYPLNAFFAEHWLYLPSIGFFLILGTVIIILRNKYSRLFPLILTVILLYIIYLSFQTILQNSYWKNQKSIYKYTLKHNPRSTRLCNNLGIIYAHEGKNKLALDMYNKALLINPRNTETYYNVGNLLTKMGQFIEAEKYYLKAIDTEPNNAKAHYCLGNLYARLNKSKKAINHYNHALSSNPYFIEAINNLGAVYYLEGNFTTAKHFWEKALSLAPDHPDPKRNLEMLQKRQAK